MEGGRNAEEAISSRTDHPTSTRGGSGAGQGSDNGRGLSEVGNYGADLLLMAEGVRELASGSGETSEGTGTGEWPTEEVGSRSGVGPCDSEGDILGKLLSPPRRRQAVKHVCQAMGVSERRACRVVGQNRSTQRHRTLAPQDEPSLATRTLQLAGEYGRYGYRRITALLRRGGAGEPQAGRENLAAGGTESAEETAPQRPAVVERWVVPSVKTVLAGSCLGVRFCGRSNPRWSSTEDLDGGG